LRLGRGHRNGDDARAPVWRREAAIGEEPAACATSGTP
jgi:hypothetical protein